MKLQKIKAALYSIYMHNRGYQVLENPQNTPSTIVRTIKYFRGIDPLNLDTYEHYYQITKDFSKHKPEKIEEYLFHDKYAFYDKSTKKLKYKDDVIHKRFFSDKVVSKQKSQIDYSELDNRDLSYVNMVIGKRKDVVPDFTYAAMGFSNHKTVTVPQTLGEATVDKFYSQTQQSSTQQTYKKSFWQVLKHNLGMGK